MQNNIMTYKPFKELSPIELNVLGLNESILLLLKQFGIPSGKLYYHEADWAYPLIYFDKGSGFEYRFTTFQQDWSDMEQLKLWKIAMLQGHSVSQ